MVGAGLVLLWRVVFSPAARAERREAPLSAWEIPLTSFLLFGCCVTLGAAFLAMLAATLARSLGFSSDAVVIASGAGAQLGMLIGALLGPVRIAGLVRPGENSRALLGGIATFLIALPLLLVTAAASDGLVRAAGLPTDKQDLLGMFARMESPGLLAAMIALAIVIAPLTEEVVFRAGIFRYLRTRLPHALALALPAVAFAALHVNWKTLAGLASLPPLVLLAVLFSLAYERTGHIGVPIVAHALFNLNTIACVLSGLVKPP